MTYILYVQIGTFDYFFPCETATRNTDSYEHILVISISVSEWNKVVWYNYSLTQNWKTD
jgi:hypothetical protein